LDADQTRHHGARPGLVDGHFHGVGIVFGASVGLILRFELCRRLIGRVTDEDLVMIKGRRIKPNSRSCRRNWPSTNATAWRPRANAKVKELLCQP
jgi:hypothetical protein